MTKIYIDANMDISDEECMDDLIKLDPIDAIPYIESEEEEEEIECIGSIPAQIEETTPQISCNPNEVSSYGEKSVVPLSFFNNSRNIRLLGKCKPLNVQIVDCNVCPWYYKKQTSKPGPKSRQEWQLIKLVKNTNSNDSYKIVESFKPTSDAPSDDKRAESPKSHALSTNEMVRISDTEINLVKEGWRTSDVPKENKIVTPKPPSMDFKKNTGMIGLKISFVDKIFNKKDVDLKNVGSSGSTDTKRTSKSELSIAKQAFSKERNENRHKSVKSADNTLRASSDSSAVSPKPMAAKQSKTCEPIVTSPYFANTEISKVNANIETVKESLKVHPDVQSRFDKLKNTSYSEAKQDEIKKNKNKAKRRKRRNRNENERGTELKPKRKKKSKMSLKIETDPVKLEEQIKHMVMKRLKHLETVTPKQRKLAELRVKLQIQKQKFFASLKQNNLTNDSETSPILPSTSVLKKNCDTVQNKELEQTEACLPSITGKETVTQRQDTDIPDSLNDAEFHMSYLNVHLLADTLSVPVAPAPNCHQSKNSLIIQQKGLSMPSLDESYTTSKPLVKEKSSSWDADLRNITYKKKTESLKSTVQNGERSKTKDVHNTGTRTTNIVHNIHTMKYKEPSVLRPEPPSQQFNLNKTNSSNKSDNTQPKAMEVAPTENQTIKLRVKPLSELSNPLPIQTKEKDSSTPFNAVPISQNLKNMVAIIENPLGATDPYDLRIQRNELYRATNPELAYYQENAQSTMAEQYYKQMAAQQAASTLLQEWRNANGAMQGNNPMNTQFQYPNIPYPAASKSNVNPKNTSNQAPAYENNGVTPTTINQNHAIQNLNHLNQNCRALHQNDSISSMPPISTYQATSMHNNNLCQNTYPMTIGQTEPSQNSNYSIHSRVTPNSRVSPPINYNQATANVSSLYSDNREPSTTVSQDPTNFNENYFNPNSSVRAQTDYQHPTFHSGGASTVNNNQLNIHASHLNQENVSPTTISHTQPSLGSKQWNQNRVSPMSYCNPGQNNNNLQPAISPSHCKSNSSVLTVNNYNQTYRQSPPAQIHSTTAFKQHCLDAYNQKLLFQLYNNYTALPPPPPPPLPLPPPPPYPESQSSSLQQNITDMPSVSQSANNLSQNFFNSMPVPPATAKDGVRTNLVQIPLQETSLPETVPSAERPAPVRRKSCVFSREPQEDNATLARIMHAGAPRKQNSAKISPLSRRLTVDSNRSMAARATTLHDPTTPKSTTEKVKKGYSPPILPIPTIQRTLEMVSAQARQKEHSGVDGSSTPKTRKHSNVNYKRCPEKRRSAEDRNEDEAKKRISFDEYKSRLGSDGKCIDLTNSPNEEMRYVEHVDKVQRKRNSSDNLLDLGYDSDSTVKL